MSINKSKLIQFITKYNLGGSAESVLFSVKKKELKTNFITDDKNVAGFIKLHDIDLPDGDYPVYDTVRLLSMLAVMGDGVDIKVQTRASDGIPTSFSITDSRVSAIYVLADKDNIPTPPTAVKEPTFTVSIDITPEFVNTFLKSRAALPDVDTFSVYSKNGEIYIALGLTSVNTNVIKIKVDGQSASDMDPIKFSARYFKEILSANKEMTSGTYRVSDAGLSVFSPVVDSIEAKYYLVKMD